MKPGKSGTALAAYVAVALLCTGCASTAKTGTQAAKSVDEQQSEAEQACPAVQQILQSVAPRSSP